jgi:hypothetical protein
MNITIARARTVGSDSDMMREVLFAIVVVEIHTQVRPVKQSAFSSMDA